MGGQRRERWGAGDGASFAAARRRPPADQRHPLRDPRTAPDAGDASGAARCQPAAAGSSLLERAAGGGRGARVVALVPDLLPGQEFLNQQRALLGPLADVEQIRHRGDLLDLLLDEPGEELLRAEVPLLAR